jgi:hypothetical protein
LPFEGNQSITLEFVGQFPTAADALSLKVVNDLAYVVEGSGGLQIIDVSTAVSPTLVSHFPTTGSAFDVDVVGQTAYIAESGLEIVDVSQPFSPTILGSYIDNQQSDVKVVNQRAYLGGQGDFRIIDISDTRNLALLGGYSGYPMSCCGELAYVTYVSYSYPDYGGFVILDVSDPGQIKWISSHLHMYASPGPIRKWNNLIYLAGRMDPKVPPFPFLDVVDVSDPGQPLQIYQSYEYTFTKTMEVTGAMLYLITEETDQSKFHLISTHDPSNLTELIAVDIPWQVTDIQVKGDLIYLAAGSEGLQILRLNLLYKMYVPLVQSLRPSLEDKEKTRLP